MHQNILFISIGSTLQSCYLSLSVLILSLVVIAGEFLVAILITTICLITLLAFGSKFEILLHSAERDSLFFLIF